MLRVYANEIDHVMVVWEMGNVGVKCIKRCVSKDPHRSVDLKNKCQFNQDFVISFVSRFLKRKVSNSNSLCS